MTEFEGLTDGTYTVVVDAIEDGLATVFFEQDGDEVGDALIDAARLPENGRHADALLRTTVTDGEVIDWSYERDKADERKQAAQDRFERLSSRAPSDEDP